MLGVLLLVGLLPLGLAWSHSGQVVAQRNCARIEDVQAQLVNDKARQIELYGSATGRGHRLARASKSPAAPCAGRSRLRPAVAAVLQDDPNLIAVAIWRSKVNCGGFPVRHHQTGEVDQRVSEVLARMHGKVW